MAENLNKSYPVNTRSSSWQPFLVVGAIILIAGLARLLPHISNMTPIFAVGVAAGAWLGRKHEIFVGSVMVITMLLGDLVLGFHWTIPFVYLGIFLGSSIGARSANWIGTSSTRAARLLKSGLVAGSASLVFFLISNFGVWLIGDLYPRSLEGLVQCFVMAVPFFKQSLVADLLFGTGSLFALNVVRRAIWGTMAIAANKLGEVNAR